MFEDTLSPYERVDMKMMKKEMKKGMPFMEGSMKEEKMDKMANARAMAKKGKKPVKAAKGGAVKKAAFGGMLGGNGSAIGKLVANKRASFKRMPMGDRMAPAKPKPSLSGVGRAVAGRYPGIYEGQKNQIKKATSYFS